MVTETVQCGRCGEWYKREILEYKEIEEEGKVEDYLCPQCDEEIKERKKSRK